MRKALAFRLMELFGGTGDHAGMAAWELHPQREVSAMVLTNRKRLGQWLNHKDGNVILALDMARSIVPFVFESDAWTGKPPLWTKSGKKWSRNGLFQYGYSHTDNCSGSSHCRDVLKFDPKNAIRGYKEIIVAPVYRAVIYTGGGPTEKARVFASVMGLPLVSLPVYLNQWEHPSWGQVKGYAWALQHRKEYTLILQGAHNAPSVTEEVTEGCPEVTVVGIVPTESNFGSVPLVVGEVVARARAPPGGCI